jgi:hypothetical protein
LLLPELFLRLVLGAAQARDHVSVHRLQQDALGCGFDEVCPGRRGLGGSLAF